MKMSSKCLPFHSNIALYISTIMIQPIKVWRATARVPPCPLLALSTVGRLQDIIVGIFGRKLLATVETRGKKSKTSCSLKTKLDINQLFVLFFTVSPDGLTDYVDSPILGRVYKRKASNWGTGEGTALIPLETWLHHRGLRSSLL